jgi:hypothetical protein
VATALRDLGQLGQSAAATGHRVSLGGRTWAVERLPGISDQLTLRDYRLSIGWERIRDGGSGVFAEVGYVFGRELEYENTSQVESFGDAAMIHAGITY